MIAIYEQNLVALELMPMLKPVATLHRLIPKRENEKPRWGGEGDLPLGNHHWVLCPPGWLRAGHYIQPRWHHPRPVVSWLSNMTINAGPSRPANSIHFTLSRAALMWDTLGRCHWVIKFKWEPVEWLGRFTMDLPFFSPFILQEERQQFPNVRTSRRDGECSHRSFPSLEPTGNMRKKRHVFFVCNKGHCTNTALC